jgi:hypothetical protein
MEYMLIFFETPAECARRDNPAEAPAYWGAWQAYVNAVRASGCVKNGHGLEPPRTATTVRVAGGKRQVQDGPFADTREHLGGYFVIDVPSLVADAACRSAAAGAVQRRWRVRAADAAGHRAVATRADDAGRAGAAPRGLVATAEADVALQRGIGLTADERVRRFLHAGHSPAE